MKKGIHPTAYRPVVFKDMSNGYTFLSRSTAASKETITFEGDDTAGRIDKFNKRYEKKAK